MRARACEANARGDGQPKEHTKETRRFARAFDDDIIFACRF